MGGSPTVNNLFAQRVVVGVGDMAASNGSSVILSTYALGSCVGVVAYDPQLPAGGLLHIMLPDSKLSPEKAVNQPSMFADTGLKHFFESLDGLGTNRSRLRILLAGGASVLTQSDMFKIGERNITAVKGWLSQNRLPFHHEELGGLNNRTVHLSITNGSVELKTPSGAKQISLV